MRISSTYLATLFSICGFFVVIAATINGVIDPLRYYHTPWLNIGYSENQRMANPGIARTQSYDIVLMGTSHTEPFVPSDMSRILGGKAVNLSMAGSFIKEQSLLLELALKQGKAKRVLWEINYHSFSLGDGVAEPASFPWFLFQPTTETPFRYLLSWDTFKESLEAISGERPALMDQRNRWDLNAEYGEERVLAHWDFMTQRWNDVLREFWSIYEVDEDTLTELIELYIASLVRQYPDVQFDLMFIPSTPLGFSNDVQISDMAFQKRIHLRNNTAEIARQHANIRVWDYQLDKRLLTSFEHYKDIYHFGQGVVLPILESLASEGHLTTPDQVVANSEKLVRNMTLWLIGFCEENPERCQPILLENLSQLSVSGRKNIESLP